VQDEPITVGTVALTPEDVVRVARGGTKVRLDGSARERVRRSRAIVDRLLQSHQPIYGLNTGLGINRDIKVPREDLEDFQRHIIMSRSVSVGPALPEDLVRAMMFVRVAGMARGGAGVQPAVVDLLIEMLNGGVHPVVASYGSLGSGDLGSLAQVSLPLIGMGEAIYKHERLPGAEALRRAGLRPVVLGPKDALALCSSNAATIGFGAEVWCDVNDIIELLDIASALSLEGFRGNVGPLDVRVHAARPHPGQMATAANLRCLLAGSYLWEPGAARGIQDPLSFRCASQVHGAIREVAAGVRGTLELELNAAADSPVVLLDDGEIISNGNFHIPQVAIGFDSLGIALSQGATMLSYRAMKLMMPEFSGLPALLSPKPGSCTGFATLQKTITCLNAEVRRAANPASLDYLPVANGQEDHATMAFQVVVKTATMVTHLRYLVALELLVAAQAVDLRGRPRLGRGTRAAYEMVRSLVAPLEDDRVIAPDVEAVHGVITSGEFLHSVRRARGAPRGDVRSGRKGNRG
jgi:histidine ammonia-lyase